MIWLAIGLGAAGLFLSAFFSGSETGFYRVARIRLVLDALGGDWIARGLLWAANHPSLFIATTLVGNNLANYVVSLAIVLAAQQLPWADGHLVQIVAPLLFAPLVFVYGELLPKNLFLRAPNRLLRKGGPLFLFFVPLFFPVSVLLWGLNRILAAMVTETPETVRLAIARRELRRVLEEGHEVGILRPAQRELAQGIFAVAQHPVSGYVSAPGQVPRAKADVSKEEIRRLARQYQTPTVLIEDSDNSGRVIGYVRLIDLDLDGSDRCSPVRPLLKIHNTANYLDALMGLHSRNESLAEVVDEAGQAVGILTAHRLRKPLFRGAQSGADPQEAETEASEQQK
jgi:CBS domain containing-hemolysin-like protein